MVPVPVERPIDFTVKAVVEGEIGVQPRAIRADVVLEKIEGVLFIINVPDLEIPIHGIEDFRTEGNVLYFRPPNPFQSHRPLARAQSLADHSKHRPPLEQGPPLDPEDEPQDILAVEPVGTDFLEGELSCCDSPFGHRAVEKKWVGP